MDNNGRLNFTHHDLNKALLAGQRAAAPHTGMNKCMSCILHTQPAPAWNDSFFGCDSAAAAATSAAGFAAASAGPGPSTSGQALSTGPDPRSYCPCADFYVRYLNVYPLQGRYGITMVISQTEGAEQDVAARVFGEGLVLKLELLHRDGRRCCIVFEPRFFLDVCFDWNTPLQVDLRHFKRMCRFAAPPRPYLYEIQLDVDPTLDYDKLRKNYATLGSTANKNPTLDYSKLQKKIRPSK